jgi:hypothetical protein
MIQQLRHRKSNMHTYITPRASNSMNNVAIVPTTKLSLSLSLTPTHTHHKSTPQSPPAPPNSPYQTTRVTQRGVPVQHNDPTSVSPQPANATHVALTSRMGLLLGVAMATGVTLVTGSVNRST